MLSDPWAWALLTAACGSLPISSWLARLALGQDLRTIGDGNPGATNVWRAGGAGWGTAALLLDVSKGAFPLGAAAVWGSQGLEVLAALAVLCVVASAFSPFLAGRGGKSLAVTLGTWIGMMRDETFLIAALALVIWTWWIRPDSWSVAFCLATFALSLALRHGFGPALLACVGQSAVLLHRHRRGLRQAPRWRRKASVA